MEFSKSYKSFGLAFSSGICLVLAFFPVGFSWLGWIAPLGLVALVNQKEMSGKRPKTQIWLGCFVCWLILFQCVRLPHWGGYIGWPFLAAFLCSYPFLFVLAARQLVHRWKIPLLVAGPVAWVGMEYIQAHFCTGISLGMLSHTQVDYPVIIQVADLAGSYTISFLLVAIACGTIQGLSPMQPRQKLLGVVQVVFCVAVLVGYGTVRINDADENSEKHDFEIALIQGSIDTMFPDESQFQAYIDSFTREYMELSKEACQGEVQLVIWPESMFPVLDVYSTPGASLTAEQQKKIKSFQWNMNVASKLATGAGILERTPTGTKLREIKKGIPMIVGANSVPEGGPQKFFNSGILINKDGLVTSRYGKMKLVLFGEFVPMGDVFPWLYNFFPIPPGLKAGEAPASMRVGEFVFCPNICFESTYPHHIRNHVQTLTTQGNEPDVIVNLSNDGWFWGSNALDMHFANNVLRAVENRTPVLIAANTGFSGLIDGAGRVLAKGPRRQKKIVTVQLTTSNQTSIYHLVGDWPAFLCFLTVLSCFFSWIFAYFTSRKLQLNKRLEPDTLKENPLGQ